MTCRLVLVVLLSFVGASAFAQSPIPIHDGFHGKTVYNSPSEWAWMSAQSHWAPCDAAETDTTLCHIHFELQFPDKGELTGLTDIPFTLMCFKATGRVTWFALTQAGDPVWDATGTTERPDLTCDPTGLKMWTGHFTLDPTRQDAPPFSVPHGWAEVAAFGEVLLDNGEVFTVTHERPYWSNVDPNAPVTYFDVYPFPMWRESASSSFDGATESFGPWYVDFRNGQEPPYDVTLTAPLDTQMEIYQYGPATVAQANVVDARADMNLHANPPILGTELPLTLVSSDGGLGTGTFNLHLDPATLGPGTHKITLRGTSTAAGPTPPGDPTLLAAAGLMTFIVTVPDTGVSIAPSCTLAATPATVTAGQSSVLTWSCVNNPTSVSLDQTIGTVSSSGSLSVTPASTTTYTLTASSAAGSTQAQATITVNPLVPPPTWQNTIDQFQRLNDQLRVCDPVDGKCLILGTLVTP